MTDLLTSAPTNGHRTRVDTSDLVPARRPRRVRLPEVAIGLIVVFGFGLAAVLWQQHATQRRAVLALAHDVHRGDVVERDDLRVVYLPADRTEAVVARTDAAALIGHVAAADMAEGTVLTRASVLEGSAIEPGSGVVGLALEPGQLPSTRLRPGDLVDVVRGPATAGAATATPGGVIVRRAEVFAVEPGSQSGRVFVSLKASEDDAGRIAAAAEAGSVRLVWVGR